MDFTIEFEKEADGRWLAEVPGLPGVLAYGKTSEEALRRTEALALRAIAERLDHGEAAPLPIRIGVGRACWRDSPNTRD